MGHITLNNKDFELYQDTEVVAWLNDHNEGYTLRDKTAALWLAILRIFDEAGPPMTVRQVFYALVSMGAIPKIEKAYSKVCYHLLQMRRRGMLPYRFIADNTRWMRKPDTYTSLEAFLKYGQEAYRRALWANQNAYVEVWCEKDALAGVIYGITEKWDVPLMITRGFPSETFVYEAAEFLKEQRKPKYLYFFGDHDPSGACIVESTETKLRDFGADFHFEQTAVLPWQIEKWNLPTRPTKRTDTRAKNWHGGSVELDAIPVSKLRELVETVITWHIDPSALSAMEKVEELEREAFDQVMQNFRLARNCVE